MVILNYIQRWDTRLRFKELLPNGGGIYGDIRALEDSDKYPMVGH